LHSVLISGLKWSPVVGDSRAFLIKRMTEEVYYIDGDHAFQDAVNVIFTDDIDESIKQQCSRLKIDTDNLVGGIPSSACVCFVDKISTSGKKILATWALFDVNKINDGVIVHECIHLSFYMLDRRGLKHVEETDEAYAYTTQWLFNKIKGFHKEYIKQKKLNKIQNIT
jgi:hypothetical protein